MIETKTEILRQVSKPSSMKESESLNVWELLLDELKKSEHGVGLAAIQIGIPIRVAIARINGEIHRLLNPEILEHSESKIMFPDEGCLSIPNKVVNTERYEWVKVKDEINGEKIYKGFEAVVVQHEIDHMNGELITDRKYQTYVTPKKIGRNEKCPCGSDKKYKKCCGK